MKVLCSRAFPGWDYDGVPVMEIAGATMVEELRVERPEVGALATQYEPIGAAVLDRLPNRRVRQ